MKNLLICSLLFIQLAGTAQAFPIQETLGVILEIQNDGRVPIAVMDLDETLIHSDKRKVASYIEALKKNSATTLSKWSLETKIAYEKLSYTGEAPMRGLANQYDSISLFRRMGIENLEFIHTLDSLMLPIYLSGEFIFLDSANRGAVGLLLAIYQAGGKVFFVTSRFESAQELATLENLKKLNLYHHPEQSFLLMRHDGESSLQFKVRSFQEIKMGLSDDEKVFMVAENEPENLNAMIDAFPTAMPVFVEGAIMHTDVALNPAAKIVFTNDFTDKGGR